MSRFDILESVRIDPLLSLVINLLQANTIYYNAF